jgi:hypothetical protein
VSGGAVHHPERNKIARDLAAYRDAPRLILAEQLGRRPPPRLILEIDIGKLLSVTVAHDEAGVVVFLDSPGWREAAGRHFDTF